MRLHPLRAAIVDPARAERVVPPAYDLLDAASRRRILEEEALSFLHAMRAADEYPEPAPLERVLADSAAGLRRLLADGVFREPAEERLFVYRLADRDHVQTGVVGELEVAEGDRIRPHETTRRDKEEHLTRYLRTVGVTSSPVSLAYRPEAAVDAAVARIVTGPPDLDFVAADAVRQQVWVVSDPERTRRLVAAFAAVERVYITDGHHRVAAIARLAAAGGHDRFLAALFPVSQLRIVTFHRLVRDLAGTSPERLVDDLRSRFVVTPTDRPRPETPGSLGMHLAGRWYRLLPRRPRPVPDAVLLQEEVLAPLLGVTDPRVDRRLASIPDVDAVAAIERAVASGEFAVAFTLRPPSLEALMAISDAGGTMPPKSTWFTPKAHSGVFLRRLPRREA